jgi:dipeptidyl aminopeptidase/acylaminoacyl peptidase
MKIKTPIVLSFFAVSFCLILLGIFQAYITSGSSLLVFGETLKSKLLNTPLIDHPLSIETLRKQSFPGSDLVIEETLADASNYHQYIASYQSEDLKIFGLLTVPTTDPPAGGFPVIIFNHGYITPNTYVTTERYVAYVDAFARNGYIVFKPDYRGHGNSDGKPEGAYYSPAYATDVLNALASIKKLQAADPDRIGMWGHSMGGNIILRDIVVNTKDIKAAVIWGGVVGTYNDLLNNWHKRAIYQPGPQELALRNTYRKNLTDQYGTPDTNPSFWKAVDPLSYISDITTPIQLHTGEEDEEVPAEFSAAFFEKLILANKTAEYFIYPQGDHDISSPNFETAMDRSIKFFDRYLK